MRFAYYNLTWVILCNLQALTNCSSIQIIQDLHALTLHMHDSQALTNHLRKNMSTLCMCVNLAMSCTSVDIAKVIKERFVAILLVKDQYYFNG